MDLTEVYYREIVGIYPFSTKREEAITRCTIAFLEESGVSDKEILNMLISLKEKAYIEPGDLPDSLWEGGLTHRDQYYCHHELQITPPDPIIKSDGTFKHYPFYLEIKIGYKIKNLLDYFYKKFPPTLREDKRNIAQLDYMLKRYSAPNEIDPLDFVLFMIDEAAYQHEQVIEPFDIRTSAIELLVLNKLRRIMDDRRANGYDRIVWRTYLTDKKGNITWQTN